MDSKRIEQYADTFERIINSSKENYNFYPQKKANEITILAGIVDEKYALAIEGEVMEFDSRNTDLITVEKFERNKKNYLIFILKDPKLLSVFATFAADIESVLDDEFVTIDKIYGRYLFWVKMFKVANRATTENTILGLINEVNLIIDYLIPNFGITKSIYSWIGPRKMHKDFTFDTGLWIEAKAISVGNKKVQVSSLEQLDSATTGYLVITEYEKTSDINKGACNLNQVFNKLQTIIENDQIMDDIYNNIMALGIRKSDIYDPKSEANMYRFIKCKTRKYIVGDGFPKLGRSTLELAIANVTYELQIDLLDSFEVDDIKGVST